MIQEKAESILMKTKNSQSDYYIAPQVKGMLDKGKHNVLEKDWDRVYLIDGGEGSGKSLLGLQLGKYLDPTFNIDRVTFSGKEFSVSIDKASKGQCIIFDEAFNGLASSGATSKMNRFIVRKLMECRQKNIFIIIILPTFFLLQKYVTLFRSQCLFHVYATKNGDRGYYKIYNRLNKKLLYLKGAKIYSYKYPYIRNSYRFYGKYPINEQEYRKKKAVALRVEEEEKKDDVYAARIAGLLQIVKEKFNVTFADQNKWLEEHGLEIKQQQMSRITTKYPINN